jgi:hypothetical protein
MFLNVYSLFLRYSVSARVNLWEWGFIDEAGKHGDGNRVKNEANEAAELEESLRDHDLVILIKNKGLEEEVLDSEDNRVLLQKGLVPKISMPSVPPDWIPPLAKVAIKGNQHYFIVWTIQGSGQNSCFGQSF